MCRTRFRARRCERRASVQAWSRRVRVGRAALARINVGKNQHWQRRICDLKRRHHRDEGGNGAATDCGTGHRHAVVVIATATASARHRHFARRRHFGRHVSALNALHGAPDDQRQGEQETQESANTLRHRRNNSDPLRQKLGPIPGRPEAEGASSHSRVCEARFVSLVKSRPSAIYNHQILDTPMIRNECAEPDGRMNAASTMKCVA